MSEEFIKNLKDVSCEAIDEAAGRLHQLSGAIWSKPELGFEEKYAHECLTTFLKEEGFQVECSYKLDTAFRSEHGGGKDTPNIAVLCEYDALPEIGHACGHNLIAEAGVGASIGIKAAIQKAGKSIGKLTLLGTPAEEDGGGKIPLIEQGAFDTIDAAMMVHPSDENDVNTYEFCAMDEITVKFYGKASHAADCPWEGVNALDAAIMCYQSISNMRQQLKPDWRVHGIITNGGAKPNIIPEYTEMLYYLRAPNMKGLQQLNDKVKTCIQGAAKATGCKFECEKANSYLNVLSNRTLSDIFRTNANGIGVDYTEKPPSGGGSTDMGNVSYVVPSIHPFYKIGSGTAVNHTREFTAVTGSDDAQAPTIKQAKAMAMTVIDVFCRPQLLTKIKEDFDEDISKAK